MFIYWVDICDDAEIFAFLACLAVPNEPPPTPEELMEWKLDIAAGTLFHELHHVQDTGLWMHLRYRWEMEAYLWEHGFWCNAVGNDNPHYMTNKGVWFMQLWKDSLYDSHRKFFELLNR